MKKSSKILIRMLVALLALTIGAAAFAQAKQSKQGPKPRKDVMKKFGLTEDPGTDPDPKKIFMRDGMPFTIEKIPRVDTREPSEERGPGWVRHRHVQIRDLEVYQENEDYVWVWLWHHEPHMPDIRYAVDEFGRQVQIEKQDPLVLEAFRRLKKEFVEIVPAPAKRTVAFEQSSAGLPTAGSWRNAADAADMNGDGFVDILLPPQRGPAGVPSVFLGDGSGAWKPWESTTFPFATNYGSVSAGDLNGDGHLDIAQAVHLRGPVVYLGDGAGNFVDASKGLPSDFPTRRLRLADLDGDGDLDLVVLSEGPVQGGGAGAGGVKVRVYLNDGSGADWTEVDVNQPDLTLGGDWVSLGDFNGDGLPDIVGSSVYYGGQALIHISTGPAKWTLVDRGQFPLNSYYFATAAGRFSDLGRDEAIMAFQRGWRWEIDPEEIPPPKSGRLSGIERVTLNGDGTITRTPIVQWLGTTQDLRAMTAADFDGDGHLDIAFVDSDLLELTVLLGDGKGGFTQATVEGVTLPDNRIYDLHVADVNADGRPDLLFLYEASETKKNGSVRVYLGMGVKGDGGA
jgi:hypothetical protein